MQIILQQDIEKLGTRGEVVEVSAGYARNYLLPQKLGMAATAGNLKRLEHMRVIYAKREATERDDAQKLADLLAAVTLTMSRKAGENDQLFGSVTSADVVEGLAAQGFSVDKHKIQLEEPIKLIGEFQVPVRLHRDVTATVKVIVQREG
jgi:large subunit ribosomal protein L9